MSAWNTGVLDNDATESAIHDLLESPRPTDVIDEALALAGGEPGGLDDDEIAGIIAAAAAVDSAVYGTPYTAHAAGLARFQDAVDDEALRSREEPLFAALGKLLGADDLEAFFRDAPDPADPRPGGAGARAVAEEAPSFEKFRANLEAIRDRLDPSYHGSQATA